MQANTDGLVIDVMRNNGGGCYMIDAAARLIPYPFFFFGEQIRATQDRLNSFQSQLDQAKAQRATTMGHRGLPELRGPGKEALARQPRHHRSHAACASFGSDWAPVRDDNPPAAMYTRSR